MRTFFYNFFKGQDSQENLMDKTPDEFDKLINPEVAATIRDFNKKYKEGNSFELRDATSYSHIKSLNHDLFVFFSSIMKDKQNNIDYNQKEQKMMGLRDTYNTDNLCAIFNSILIQYEYVLTEKNSKTLVTLEQIIDEVRRIDELSNKKIQEETKMLSPNNNNIQTKKLQEIPQQQQSSYNESSQGDSNQGGFNNNDTPKIPREQQSSYKESSQFDSSDSLNQNSSNTQGSAPAAPNNVGNTGSAPDATKTEEITKSDKNDNHVSSETPTSQNTTPVVLDNKTVVQWAGVFCVFVVFYTMFGGGKKTITYNTNIINK